MSVFRVSYDWFDFGNDADHRWLQVTFAQVTITVGEAKVTRLLDRRARTTREFAVIPLYPFSEWIVANWWSLFEEAEVPSRGTSSNEYRSRHAIREGREGYAVPDLEFFPEGDWTRITWKPSAALFQSVEFLESGHGRVRTDEVRQVMTELIDGVTSRLEAHGIFDTWLQKEWQALQQVTPDEREFCLAAGQLGLDPYQLGNVTADEIVQAADRLPKYLRAEVLKATPVAKLALAADWVQSGLHAIESSIAVDGSWKALREKIPQASGDGLPWEVGYQMAQKLRGVLALGDTLQINIDELVGSPIPVIEAVKPPSASFDGLLGVGNASICCFTAKLRPDSKRFICTRGLLSFLFDKSIEPEFYSSAQTNRQQRSRAFAAEFLAPARLIAQRLSSDDISNEEVEELASEFQVSAFVIDHQIRNHRLGKIVGR
jgi:hypothetical protein